MKEMKERFEERKAIRREKLEAEGKKPKEIEATLEEEFGKNSKAYKTLKRKMISGYIRKIGTGATLSSASALLKGSVYDKLPRNTGDILDTINNVT